MNGVDYWALYVILVAAMVGSLMFALLQLPGLWLLLACAAGYAYLTGGAFLGIWTLIVLLVLALGAEVIETFAAAGGAGKAGASKTAMVFSVVGAIVGGLTFTLVPIPVIGTIVGVCVGAFLGAMVAELAKGRGRDQSIRSGLGAAVGRLVGTVIKLSIGVGMFLIAAIMAIPWSQAAPAAAPPAAAAPTTLPVEQ